MEKMETSITVRDEGDATSVKKKQSFVLSRLSSLPKKIGIEDPRKLIHSIKVGIALVLVSLLYLLQPLFDHVGDNAMWAIMTVVVVFEFYAGATLSKGLNRGIGTIMGGGLGCAIALLAFEIGGIGRAIAIGVSVFIFGAVATYSRLVPRIKKKYDYGAMIFILTFNLVAVSGYRGQEIIQIASDRLVTIMIGFVICVFASLFIFPVWAGDELHGSLVSKFEKLAVSIEECVEEFFKPIEEKAETQSVKSDGCTSVLYSKSTDETLANFARWEPWHGKFGFSYPWNKYLRIGDLLRELASSIYFVQGCLRSNQQASTSCSHLVIKEPSEAVGALLSFTLRELADNIVHMRRCQSKELIVAKLESTRLQLCLAVNASRLRMMVNGNDTTGGRLSIASFVFVMMELVDKVEALAKEVEELGELADFLP